MVINLAVAVVATCLALCGVELATRAAYDIPLLSATNFVTEAVDIVRANSGSLVYDDLVGWRLKDNVTSDGFNSAVHGVRLNSGSQRILPFGAVLTSGDSFTAGSGVRDEETWPAQVERLARQPVVNASSGAWGGDQIVLNVERLVPILKPKTLVVSFLADDSLRNSYSVYGGGPKPYFTIDTGKLSLHNVPVPRSTSNEYSLDIARKVFGHSLFVMRAAQATGLMPGWIGAGRFSYRQIMSYEDGVRVSCLLMDKLAAIQQGGVRVIFMVQYNGPASMQDEPPWYGPPVLACARERGLETVDTFPPLHRVSLTHRDRFLKFWIDESGQMGHMTAAGSAFIAELVANALSNPN